MGRQNSAILDYLRSIGHEVTEADLRPPEVSDLLKDADDPNRYEGPGYRPDLGRYSAVFSDEQVVRLSSKGFFEVPASSVRMPCLPSGRVMFRPAEAEARAQEARKIRDMERRTGRRDRSGGRRVGGHDAQYTERTEFEPVRVTGSGS